MISTELQSLFDYGEKHELNALTTLLGKIIPVFYPHLSYIEDGCKILQFGDSYAVISGDGHGEDSSGACPVAFEFKCPLPGKTRTTDLHYTLPHYYTTQVLAEMNSHKCSNYAYVCFTPDATTLITGSNDDALWKEVWDLTVATYGDPSPKRPSKRTPGTAELVAKLKEFASESSFMCEFPSIFGSPCSCDDTKADPTLSPWGKHGVFDGTEPSTGGLTLDETLVYLQRSKTTMIEAYNILKRPAKEVLVTVASDLNPLTASLQITTHLISLPNKTLLILSLLVLHSVVVLFYSFIYEYHG